MKIVLWGKGERSMNCLSALHDKGYKVELVVGHPEEKLKEMSLFWIWLIE